ncbi:unnamed protein product [Ectocarpus sp. CCAP 1310/34]|nr:unnamed protein product [Ectocarpus sp. CCAP 1310/34]
MEGDEGSGSVGSGAQFQGQTC